MPNSWKMVLFCIAVVVLTLSIASIQWSEMQLLRARITNLEKKQVQQKRVLSVLEKKQAQQKRVLSVTRYAAKRLVEDPYNCTVGQRPVCADLE